MKNNHTDVENFAGLLSETGVLPILSVNGVKEAVLAASAFQDAGFRAIEITFRTTAAAEAIMELSRSFPDLVVGAGTVLDRSTLEIAFSSGASFAVAPGCNPKMLETAKEMGVLFIPGVCTATDIETAFSHGARLLKFFPAEACGGSKMLKALLSPYGHLGIRFLATGGINSKNMREYLDIKAVVGIGGSWMLDKDELALCDADGIRRRIMETSRDA